MSTASFDAALRNHAAKLLAGTGLTLDQAHQIASGQTPATGPVEAALHDGWASTDTTADSDSNASASVEGAS